MFLGICIILKHTLFFAKALVGILDPPQTPLTSDEIRSLQLFFFYAFPYIIYLDVSLTRVLWYFSILHTITTSKPPGSDANNTNIISFHSGTELSRGKKQRKYRVWVSLSYKPPTKQTKLKFLKPFIHISRIQSVCWSFHLFGKIIYVR